MLSNKLNYQSNFRARVRRMILISNASETKFATQQIYIVIQIVPELERLYLKELKFSSM